MRPEVGILDANDRDTWRSGSSFTLGNRIYRLLWCIAWGLLASWTPPQFGWWRRLLLRLFGAKMSSTSMVYASARVWSPANLEMGEYAFIGPGVTVYSIARIVCEPYSLVSQRAHLCTGTHDIEDVNFQLQGRSITIGYRAWVASEAFVGPGVSVGEGAVLGARGCAMGNLNPWTVYVGNPARPIKKRRVRFPDRK